MSTRFVGDRPPRSSTTRASLGAVCSTTTSTPTPCDRKKRYSAAPLAFILNTLRESSDRSTKAQANAVAYVSSGCGGAADGGSGVIISSQSGHRLGALSEEASVRAIRRPFADAGVRIEDAAAEMVYRRSGGYPYFIQEWGYQLWNFVGRSPVTRRDVETVDAVVTEQGMTERF